MGQRPDQALLEDSAREPPQVRSPSSSETQGSRCLVDQEGDLALFKAEVDEAIAFMDGVAAEAFAQKDVPVGFPPLVHVFLDN